MTTALKIDRRDDARLKTVFPPPGVVEGPMGVFDDQEKRYFQEEVRRRAIIAGLESELDRALASRLESALKHARAAS